jgi:hypothetical protein
MAWPFVKNSMPDASRGGGGLNVNGGGGVTKPKPLPYDPPKTTSGGRVDNDPGKGTNHGTAGTQGRH